MYDSVNRSLVQYPVHCWRIVQNFSGVDILFYYVNHQNFCSINLHGTFNPSISSVRCQRPHPSDQFTKCSVPFEIFYPPMRVLAQCQRCHLTDPSTIFCFVNLPGIFYPDKSFNFKRRMVEINKVGTGNKESTPPSLTPVKIRYSNCFLVSFLCVSVDLCSRQLPPYIDATKLTILQHLIMGRVLGTESKSHQTKMYTCFRWCVKGNGAWVGVSNNGNQTNKCAEG
jgi:hypothetical protein